MRQLTEEKPLKGDMMFPFFFFPHEKHCSPNKNVWFGAYFPSLHCNSKT